MSMASHDAFLSYFRNKDDEEYNAWIDQFCKKLSARVRLHTPNGDPFCIFHDRQDMRVSPLEWEQQIKHALTNVKLLLVILTRPYFNRRNCRKEVEWFLELNERSSGGLKGLPDTANGIDSTPWIIPIEYTNIPTLAVDDDTGDIVLEAIRKQQRKDWKNLRFLDFDSQEVRREMDALAMEIAETLVLLDPQANFYKPVLPKTPSKNIESESSVADDSTKHLPSLLTTIPMFTTKSQGSDLARRLSGELHHSSRIIVAPGVDMVGLSEQSRKLQVTVEAALHSQGVVQLTGFASDPVRLGIQEQLQILVIGVRAGVKIGDLADFDKALNELASSFEVRGIAMTKILCANIADVVKCLERRTRHIVLIMADSLNGTPLAAGRLEFPDTNGQSNFIYVDELLNLCPSLRVVGLTNLGGLRSGNELYGLAEVSRSLFVRGVAAMGISDRPPPSNFAQVARFWRLFVNKLSYGGTTTRAAQEARDEALADVGAANWVPVVFSNQNSPQPFRL